MADARVERLAVELHVAPGLGNAMGMLYDAFKAHSPLLLTAGQHDAAITASRALATSSFAPARERR